MAVVDDLAPGMDASPPSEDYGRQPPQDLAAEQSVLGGMLLSKDAIADVLERLRAVLAHADLDCANGRQCGLLRRHRGREGTAAPARGSRHARSAVWLR